LEDHKAGWARFPHDADVGIRGCGPTAEQAFEQAAHALTAIITSVQVEPDMSIQGARSRTAGGRMAQHHHLRNGVWNMLCGQFLVRIEDGRLAGTLRGDSVDACKDVGAVVAAAEQARLALPVARLKPLICIKE
jgi:tRNA nucleotidyltransferase (CCA-adding enzyme)